MKEFSVLSFYILCRLERAPLTKMASCEFSKYVGGDCGASLVLPSGDLCVRISECSKDIKGHLETCCVSDGTLCSEATLLLTLLLSTYVTKMCLIIGIFEEQEQYFNLSVCPRHCDAFGLRWRSNRKFMFFSKFMGFSQKSLCEGRVRDYTDTVSLPLHGLQNHRPCWLK